MATGKVKWFNNAKGYGFILPEGGGEDLFVHYSSIQMDGYKTLKAGQDVSFDMLAGPKGHHAVNIRLVDADSDRPGIGIEVDEFDDLSDSADAAEEEAPVVYNGSSGSTS